MFSCTWELMNTVVLLLVLKMQKSDSSKLYGLPLLLAQLHIYKVPIGTERVRKVLSLVQEPLLLWLTDKINHKMPLSFELSIVLAPNISLGPLWAKVMNLNDCLLAR